MNINPLICSANQKLVKADQILGFGEHSKPTSEISYQIAKRIYQVAIGILAMGIAIGSVALISIPLIVIPSAAIVTLPASLSAIAIFSAIHYKSKKSAFYGIMNNINKEILNPPTEIGRYSDCQAIVCEDTKESFVWKKKLIESAEHNIILSGNYCGGNSFDEILNLLSIQLKNKPLLKIVVISSDKFINNKNKMLISKVIENYPDRFQLIQSKDIWHLNPGLKKTTNHSKILAIDYGQYFLLGGSGVEDKYAYATGLGDRGIKKQQSEIKGLLGLFLPRGFRDQDFVFFSTQDDGIGRRVYLETLKLALRWEGINQSNYISTDKIISQNFKKSNSLAKSLLIEETKIKEIKQNKNISEFAESKGWISNLKAKIFCIGPEHSKNPWEETIYTRIKQAKERIIIDHMYFHPTARISNALADAAKRGVKIKLITNGYNKNKSPKGHAAFVPRNRYNYNLLAKKIDKEYKNNLEIYEFEVKKQLFIRKSLLWMTMFWQVVAI